MTDVGFEERGTARRPSDTVAGYLAAVSIFISVIGVA